MDIARQVLNLNINDILPNRFQPRIRFSEDALAELTNSIKEHGVIQPITVRPVGNKYEIVAGERRYKASVLAGKETIPAIVVNLDDNSCAELALIENVQRQDLTPIEEAISYKKILDMGSLTQEALAIKLGKNQSTIANKLRLLNLDEDVQKALLENRISERHARSLLKINDKNEQRQMLQRIINERLTVRRTDEEINKLLNNNENKRMVGEDNSMNGNTNNMNNNIPNMNNNLNYDVNQTMNNQNYNQTIVPNMPNSQNVQNNQNIEIPNNQMGSQFSINQIGSDNLNLTNQTFTNDISNNQNNALKSEPRQNIPTPEEVNRLIEQANQITPDFNIPNTPIDENSVTINDIPTQTQVQANIQMETPNNHQTSMPSFNNMEIQSPIPNQMNIPTTPIEESDESAVSQNDNMNFTSAANNSDTNSPINDNELRPVKFFNMIDEQPQKETNVQTSTIDDVFNIKPEMTTQNDTSIPMQPTFEPISQNTNSNSNQPEFIDNLEDQAVNMDFGSNNVSSNNFNFSAIPNATIEQPQTPNEPVIQKVNIPKAPTMSSTIDIPDFLNEETQELKPKMPENKQQPIRNINIRQAVDEIRQSTNKIENMGFNIDTEEYDLDQYYQIVIKISKE